MVASMNLDLQKAAHAAGLSVDLTDYQRFAVSDGVARINYLQVPGSRLLRIDATAPAGSSPREWRKACQSLAHSFERLIQITHTIPMPAA